jgi:predicted transcriptional regulator
MNTRFEIRIPAEQRARLDALAADAGLSSSDLARLAIGQILEDRAVRLPKVDAAQDNRRHSLTETSS